MQAYSSIGLSDDEEDGNDDGEADVQEQFAFYGRYCGPRCCMLASSRYSSPHLATFVTSFVAVGALVGL